MRQCILAAALVTGLLFCRTAAAQTPGPEADPGVRPTRLIDQEEVRVSRVEIQAGATRRVHTHDDVEFHLWIPIEGTLELSMRTDPPIAAKPGQAYFMARGTPHGFKNIGTTPAAVFEIFIKPRAGAAAHDQADVLAMALAAFGGSVLSSR